MISHKHKCIFIHIPHTGGTFIEECIVGQDYWNIDKSKKHLFASQTKRFYKKYWNSYFKFSFVRDPYARCASLIGAKFYCVKINNNKINIDGYRHKFGYPICIENDYRFSNREDVFNPDKHVQNAVYLNYLDEQLDFIGKYENFSTDLRYVLNKIKCSVKPAIKIATKSYDEYYTYEAIEKVFDLYRNDILHFGYNFGDGRLCTRKCLI